MAYTHAKFEFATSNGLGENTITRNVTDVRTDRLWYEINVPYFSNEKAGITQELYISYVMVPKYFEIAFLKCKAQEFAIYTTSL